MMKFKKPIELICPVVGTSDFYAIYIYQSGAGGYKFKTIKAVTIAVSNKHCTERSTAQCLAHPVGVSACSNLDTYDVNKGIIKAVGRCQSKSSELVYVKGDEENYKQIERLAIKTAKRIDRRNQKRVMNKIMDAIENAATRRNWEVVCR